MKKTAKDMREISNLAYANKTNTAADVLTDALLEQIWQEARYGWYRIDVILAALVPSLHMSFDDDILEDIIKLVRKNLVELGYTVTLSGKKKHQMISIEW